MSEDKIEAVLMTSDVGRENIQFSKKAMESMAIQVKGAKVSICDQEYEAVDIQMSTERKGVGALEKLSESFTNLGKTITGTFERLQVTAAGSYMLYKMTGDKNIRKRFTKRQWRRLRGRNKR